jgi:tricorn protease-like protein
METVEQKPLREEILKVEVDLRHVKDPDNFLQQLKQTLKQFDIDKCSLELIPIFFPGKKWYVPENTFVSLSVAKDTCVKLSQWDHNKDSLIVHANDGELLILNKTKLDEWRFKQNMKETRTKDESR